MVMLPNGVHKWVLRSINKISGSDQPFQVEKRCNEEGWWDNSRDSGLL